MSQYRGLASGCAQASSATTGTMLFQATSIGLRASTVHSSTYGIGR